jgi:hypothetical protein
MGGITERRKDQGYRGPFADGRGGFSLGGSVRALPGGSRGPGPQPPPSGKAQREVAFRYCRTESGTKIARMIATQISV